MCDWDIALEIWLDENVFFLETMNLLLFHN